MYHSENASKIKVLIAFTCEIEYFAEHFKSLSKVLLNIQMEHFLPLVRENWIPASELIKLQRTKWLMKLSSNMFKKRITKKRMLYNFKWFGVSRLNIVIRYIFFLPYPLLSTLLWLVHPDFSLILYHFAFRTPIMLHEIDINKTLIPNLFNSPFAKIAKARVHDVTQG